MKKLKMGSVFKKLYLLFIATMAIIYVCTIFIFLTYAGYQKRTETQAMQASVRQGVSDLREQLDIVANLEKNLVSDSRTLDLYQNTNLDAYEISRLRIGLLGSMRSFQSMNNIIKEIAILFPEQEMELSTVGEMSRKECISAERAEGDTARTLVYSDGQVQMELWYPLTRSVEEGYIPDYGVRVTLAEEYLNELLERFAVEKQTGGFSVLATGEGLLQIPETDSERKGMLMESWRQAWEEAGCPISFLGNAGVWADDISLFRRSFRSTVLYWWRTEATDGWMALL